MNFMLLPSAQGLSFTQTKTNIINMTLLKFMLHVVCAALLICPASAARKHAPPLLFSRPQRAFAPVAPAAAQRVTLLRSAHTCPAHFSLSVVRNQSVTAVKKINVVRLRVGIYIDCSCIRCTIDVCCWGECLSTEVPLCVLGATGNCLCFFKLQLCWY